MTPILQNGDNPLTINFTGEVIKWPRVIYFRYFGKVKVKCTLVQALRLYIGHTAHRGSRGIALLFYDHGTRRG